MDGSAAIERNRVALKRIVLSLFAMAGLAEAAAGAHPPLDGEGRTEGSGWGGALKEHPARGARQPGDGAGGPHPEGPKDGQDPWLAPKAKGEPRRIPRHLWRAILRLLRPAESAARRLIVAAARGIAVTVPPARSAPTLPRGASGAKHGASALPAPGAGPGEGAAPRIPAFALLDPLRNPLRKRRRMTPPHAAPRIMLPGVIEPFRLPPPPSPDDEVGAARLGLRLAALAAALDDLPGQARRFARWKAARDAAGAQNKESEAKRNSAHAPGRFRRISPLRAGRPPGGRLSRYDPHAAPAGSGPRTRPIREIDLILAHAHELAFDALTRPDTS